MQITNNTFFNLKIHLYSKPVKGLQGYGLSYGFAFNGQEKDDEVSGTGNTMTAEFWEYDSRLGRRWNMDPRGNLWESAFVCFRNNPIKLIDPNGAEVINGDKEQANQTKKVLDQKNSSLKEMANKNNINDNTKKRDFIKSGGDKNTWKAYKELKNGRDKLASKYNEQLKQANVTQQIIDKWAKVSSNVYNEVNNRNEKFYLFSLENFYDPDNGKRVFGENDLFINDDNEFASKRFGGKGLDVYIDASVKLDFTDIFSGGVYQFALNHEAGHWLYLMKHPEHLQYILQHHNDKDYEGGHHTNDKCGQEAKKYGTYQN